MDRKRALNGIFIRCAADLDLKQQVNDEAVTDQDVVDTLEKWITEVSRILVAKGFSEINEEEKTEIQFRLGQRRVNVNPGDETVVLQGARVEPWLAKADIKWKFWEFMGEKNHMK